ncbi:MAG: hypothetical protein HC904_02760 [Blastochloris sp.]|nr:hypothetical protein [Blastochloris sp.]
MPRLIRAAVAKNPVNPANPASPWIRANPECAMTEGQDREGDATRDVFSVVVAVAATEVRSVADQVWITR